MPTVDVRAEAKELMLRLIRASGGVFTGKTRLHKAFYLAHLFHWTEHKGALTSHPIARLPHGPGIHDGDTLIRELQDEGKLTVESRPNGPYKEILFRLNEPVSWDPNAEENACIEDAVQFVQGRTATELSDLMHEYSRSWQQTPHAQEMDIYSDVLEEPEYLDIKRDVADAGELLKDVFGPQS